MKNLLLLPVRFCASILYKIADLFLSAMKLSAMNWLKIGYRAADSGLEVAQTAHTHIAELAHKNSEPAQK